MKRVWACLIALLLFTAPTFASLPKQLASVQPLWDHERGICTTWSINQHKGLWATAAHCVEPEDDFYRDIAGQVVTVVKVDPSLDLALLHVDNTNAPAIKLGKSPKVGAEITVYGYPMAWGIPVATWGYVSSPYLMNGWAPEWPFANMILDIRSLPGHSGSPVIDSRGKVISMLQGIVYLNGGSISLGIPWKTMKTFYEGVWEH